MATGADEFDEATPIAVGETSDPTDNRLFGPEDDEQYPANGQTAWWSITPTTDGWIGVDLDLTLPYGAVGANGVDTALSVFTGEALETATLVWTQDDSMGTYQSRLAFWGEMGTTYKVQADAYEDCDYVLRVTPLQVQVVRPNWVSGDLIEYIGSAVPDYPVVVAPNWAEVLADDDDATWVDLKRDVHPHPDPTVVQQVSIYFPDQEFFAVDKMRIRAKLVEGAGRPWYEVLAFFQVPWVPVDTTGVAIYGTGSVMFSPQEVFFPEDGEPYPNHLDGETKWYESVASDYPVGFDRYMNNANVPGVISNLSQIKYALQPYWGGGPDAADIKVRVYEVELHVFVPATVVPPETFVPQWGVFLL